MRKPFAATMALVLILGSASSGVCPAFPHTASAYSPPPPALPAPTPPSAGSDVADQPLPTPPSPDDLAPEMEQARVRQAAQAVLDKYAEYYGPRYQMDLMEVAVEGGWAYAVAQPETGSGETLHLLAHRGADGVWQALMPSGDGLYLRWVDAVPESLLSPTEKYEVRRDIGDFSVGHQNQGGITPVLSSVVGESVDVTPTSQPPTASPSVHTVTLSLDGVELNLSTSFLSDPRFETSDPNTAIQVATAMEREPIFKEISITAVPFGLEPPTESLPRANSQSEEIYRSILRKYREEQKGNPEDGPVMNIFDEETTGLTSVVDLHIYGEELTPVAVTEWIVEAGNRIWIIRASQELKGNTIPQPQLASLTDSFSNTKLGSDSLSQPSTSLRAVRQNLPPTSVNLGMRIEPNSVSSDLPFPSWWDGDR